MSFETILFDKREHVAIITLNRPDRLNAISTDLRSDVAAAVKDAHDDDGIRALVITGVGRGFCSGADLSAVASGVRGTLPEPTTQAGRLDEDGWVGRWAKMFHRFDKPVIAAVNGIAAGAGMRFRADQLPVYFGLRFSLNASIASFASLLARRPMARPTVS
jgi:2-(1,2-epoxy-1,2-dihydrophenyl)acetyl-CoA isomerase